MVQQVAAYVVKAIYSHCKLINDMEINIWSLVNFLSVNDKVNKCNINSIEETMNCFEVYTFSHQ